MHLRTNEFRVIKTDVFLKMNQKSLYEFSKNSVLKLYLTAQGFFIPLL
jgi:hypothetical protein